MAIRILFLLLSSISLWAQPPSQPEKTPATASVEKTYRVFVIPIRAEIDPRTNRVTQLGLAEALQKNADIVIVDMNTYGGAVVDADSIRTRFMDFKKPIWVFINDNAASAGALISLACDSIYMSPGATIGAATVVTGEGAAAPDKYQSYFKAKMRETARHRGRDPRIAEAMVDERIAIDSITEEGQVITFTTDEAIRFGFCEAEMNDIAEILERNGITNYTIERFELSFLEKIIAIFLNPFVSGILILVIIGGLYFELQTPGVGFPIIASLTALVLYFIPHYLHGLAEYWEILLFFAGIVLLLVELLIIPGFGVAGITGIICCFTALVLIMLDNNFFDFRLVNEVKVRNAFIALGIGFLGSILLVTIGGVGFIKSKFFQRMAVTQEMRKEAGYTSSGTDNRVMIGKKGTTYTDLRPGGKIMIDGAVYDAASRGEYIEKGRNVEVLKVNFWTLIVKETGNA